MLASCLAVAPSQGNRTTSRLFFRKKRGGRRGGLSRLTPIWHRLTAMNALCRFEVGGKGQQQNHKKGRRRAQKKRKREDVEKGGGERSNVLVADHKKAVQTANRLGFHSKSRVKVRERKR